MEYFTYRARPDDDRRRRSSGCSAARRGSRRRRLTQREMDLARSIQDVTEEVMLKMARVRAPRDRACATCVWPAAWRSTASATDAFCARGRSIEIWIQPAAGDAGGALGVALSLWHRYLEQAARQRRAAGTWERPSRPRRRGIGARRRYADGMSGSYPRPAFSDDEIARVAGRCTATRRDGCEPRDARRARRGAPGRRRRSSGCCRAGWSSVRARSAGARSSATRARRRCSR